MWNNDIDQWLNCDDFIQVACFLIDFDTEFLNGSHQEYEITSFGSEHKLSNETVKIIGELAENLYIHTDFDIWELLFKYLEEQIAKL